VIGFSRRRPSMMRSSTSCDTLRCNKSTRRRRSTSFSLQCGRQQPKPVAKAEEEVKGEEWCLLAKGLRAAFFCSSEVTSGHPAAAYLAARDPIGLRDELLDVGRWKAHEYTRTMLLDGDGFSVMLLSWAPGCSSPVHAHSCAESLVASNCFMLVLEGTLSETVYTEDAILADGRSVDGRLGKTRALEAGKVAYINDQLGLHKVGNPTGARAVSLHVYAPGWKRAPLYEERLFHEVMPAVDAGGAEIDDLAGWGDF